MKEYKVLRFKVDDESIEKEICGLANNNWNLKKMFVVKETILILMERWKTHQQQR